MTSHTTRRMRAASCADIHRSNGALDSLPVNFDPASCPIISQPFFGVEPFRPISKVAAEVVADLRFRH